MSLPPHKPRLTRPLLLPASLLATSPPLQSALLTLCNAAFARSQIADPDQWTYPKVRFTSPEQLVQEYGAPGSVVGVILDEAAAEDGEGVVEVAGADVLGAGEGEAGAKRKGRLVACAGLVPWKGVRGGADVETVPGAWEVKTVCVDDAEAYFKTGLAVRLLGALEGLAVERERGRLREVGEKEGKGRVKLWVVTAECVNGKYWKGKGWTEEVGREAQPVGVWGCKKSFVMLTLRRVVEFEV